MQFLGPAEKGVNAKVSIFYSPNHLSGLNSCGSGKYLGFIELADIPGPTRVPDHIIIKSPFLI